jgi:UDP-N-acetylmuramoylalanine--D-glutamate ligase
MALSLPDFLRSLLKLPVAVVVGGVSGPAVLRWLKKRGSFGLLFDEKFTRIGFVNNSGSAHLWANWLVVVSPGLSRANAWLKAARAWGCTCLSELDFASLFWASRLIATPGTNGKPGNQIETLVNNLGATATLR